MAGGSWGILQECQVSRTFYVDILSYRFTPMRDVSVNYLINSNTHTREHTSSLSRLGSCARVPSKLWHASSRAGECAARAAQATGAMQLLPRKRLLRSPPSKLHGARTALTLMPP